MFKELFAEALTGRTEGLDWKYSRGSLTIYGENTGKPIFKKKIPETEITKELKKFREERGY